MSMLSLTDVAARLGITPRSVRHLIRTRGLPHVRLAGRTIRVREESLAAWMEQQEEVYPCQGSDNPTRSGLTAKGASIPSYVEDVPGGWPRLPSVMENAAPRRTIPNAKRAAPYRVSSKSEKRDEPRSQG